VYNSGEEEFAKLFEEAGALAASDKAAAYDMLTDLARALLESGQPRDALRLTKAAREVLPKSWLRDERLAWLLNTEALASLHLGRRGRAKAKFNTMLGVGRRRRDCHD
jgi:tetratricopeptide (TPR) repeat protein